MLLERAAFVVCSRYDDVVGADPNRPTQQDKHKKVRMDVLKSKVEAGDLEKGMWVERNEHLNHGTEPKGEESVQRREVRREK